jgi:Virulence factor BrkB
LSQKARKFNIFSTRRERCGEILGPYAHILHAAHPNDRLSSRRAVATTLFAWQMHLRWSDVLIGGLARAIFFDIGKIAIGYYIARSAFASVYGASGSLLIFFLWAYYSAQVLLFGAEVTNS